MVPPFMSFEAGRNSDSSLYGVESLPAGLVSAVQLYIYIHIYTDKFMSVYKGARYESIISGC